MSYNLERLCDVGMPIAMATLVEAASLRAPTTYKAIAARIERRLRSTVATEHVGVVVGSMMDEILAVAPKAPPLNIMCVYKATKLPGDGAHYYIMRYNPKIDYNSLILSKQREALLPVYEDIFKFNGWPQIARKAFGISVLTKPESQQLQPERDGKAKRLGFGGPPESHEHRRLKEYVQKNPKLFGAPVGCKKGVIEKLLKSHDEIDVWFVSPGEQLAVEVKSHRSPDLDLQRGIFQCVKYRAILQAENKAERITSNVRACLVSERKLPDDLSRLARLLAVDVKIASPL